MSSGWFYGLWLIRFLGTLLLTAFNLLPLYGVWAWNWDPFQILILYWLETVVIAASSLAQIASVPADGLGEMTVNGRVVKATRSMTIKFFAVHAGAFICVHLLFLCVLFSGDWFSRAQGVSEFLRAFFITSGVWIPLLLAVIAGVIDVLTAPYRPPFMHALARRLRFADPPPPPTTPDPVGSIVGTLYGRIAIMQVAIIAGAWLAQRWGSLAPLVIVVAIKTLFDLGSRLSRRATLAATWTVEQTAARSSTRTER